MFLIKTDHEKIVLRVRDIESCMAALDKEIVYSQILSSYLNMSTQKNYLNTYFDRRDAKEF